MKAWNLIVLQLFLSQIAEYLSSPVKEVKANRRLLAAILGYRKEDVGFINDVIGIHNKYRTIHGCRDLSQCARLRQQAGMYAQELADQGAREPFKHPKLKLGIGENIYISCGNEVTAEEAVNHWYNEACNYFGNKKTYEDYKHFAQVVWKATYLIGVGRRTSTKSGQKCTYVVTRYRPGAESGPAESINIPKGNFDSSICSGNSVGTGGNMQASAGITAQTGNKGTPSSAVNSGESISGKPAQGQKERQPSESGGFVGPSNAGANVGQSAAEAMPASQSGSSEVVVLPSGSQPAKYSVPAGSMTETGGSTAGSSGITGSNNIPNVTPTSVPGTGDRERAGNPENSHVSPLIEQPETGSKGSLEESGDQQVSSKPSPHCPPCPGNEIQTESFETSGGAESLPESNNNPGSAGEGQSIKSNPDQMTGSSNPGNPQEQSSPSKPDKSTEQVSPVNNNPANPGKSPEPKVNPVEQAKPDNKQNNPGNGKECPPCSCPKKERNEKPGAPQGSQVNQIPSGGESKSSPNQKRPGEEGGNGVSQGQPSGKDVSQGAQGGKEVSQGQSSGGNNAPTNEVKPNSEGNISPPSSNQGGGEGNSSPVNEGNTGSSGINGASENQPTKENQSAETGGPSGITSGGSEGSIGATGASSGGNGESQGATENQSQSTGNAEGAGEGSSAEKPGSTGTGGVQEGQAGATQGTSGQGGGESGSKPEGGAFIESLDVFQQSALEAHNKYRQLHNSPPLTHNREMSTQATEFAKKLAESGIANAEHSLKSSRENQGENVYTGCATNPSGSDVTKEWYKELCNYDYNKNAEIDEKKPIGHFTQVVWKSSTEFGIGRAYSADKNCVYIVARYKPAGNVIGSEVSNIARSTMDGEYCGREFMAFNKPENGKTEEGMSAEGQPNGVSEVGSQVPNHATNGGDQQESGNAGSEGNQQNTITGGSEAPASSNVQGNQQNTNTGEASQSETTSTNSEGNQPETSIDSNNGQPETKPSGEGDRNKRIRTPFLPGYLQKSVAENTNKRYRGLRTE